LTACDLRCSWCDTPYAFHEGRKMSVERVMEEIADIDCSLVEVTGGEPLLQPDVYPLVTACSRPENRADRDRRAHPAGSRAAAVVKIMDVKCPGSGESAKNRLENLGFLSERDEVKFVIADRVDYEFARTS